MSKTRSAEKIKREPLGRYETICIHCGSILREIDMPIKQYCHCRKIYACNGCVYDVEPEEKKDQQELFY